jgi:hypothetical protein
VRNLLMVIAGVVVVAAIVLGVVWSGSTQADRSPEDGATDASGAVELTDGDDLPDLVGQRVTVSGAEVESVPADEGFRVDLDEGAEFWVDIDVVGESPVDVDTGDQISFTGVVVEHDTGDAPDGSPRDAGVHVEVDADAISLG